MRKRTGALESGMGGLVVLEVEGGDIFWNAGVGGRAVGDYVGFVNADVCIQHIEVKS
jgi:hypothetical protein